MAEKEEMSLEEMRALVADADEVDFIYRQHEQRAWEKEQRAKAPEVVALLRRHIPADRLPEIEDYLSCGFGRDYLGQAIWRDQTRTALRRHVPEEHWQEIEEYLDSGIGRGRVGVVLDALRSEEGWTPRSKPGW